jgi:CheY-like chemotaxis protein
MMTARSGRPVRILLVEDNPADVRLIREALKTVGSACDLAVVEDGEQALGFLEGCLPGASPELVLLDLNLPRKSGTEVLTEMKKNPYWKRIPVIVLTSSGSESDVNSAYDCGANSYLRKPTDLSNLYSLTDVLASFWLKWAVLPTPADEHGC